MHVAFPFRIDGRGRSAKSDDANYIKGLIEQLLFTAPGERVNRPDFGTGVMSLVFAPNSPELATATEYTIQGALQQRLGELIQVEAVKVENEEATLTVGIQYLIRGSNERTVAEFTQSV